MTRYPGLVIEIPKDYMVHYLMGYETLQELPGGVCLLSYTPEQWAPGVFAGIEGFTFQVAGAGPYFRVVSVDLTNRKVVTEQL